MLEACVLMPQNNWMIFQLESIQLDIVTMAEQSELFYSLRQLYKTLDIYPSKTNQTYRFKWKTIFFVFPIILMFITSFAFFLWEAETVDDYGTSFYGSMTQLSQTHNILMIIWQMPTILELFRKFENLIESS